MRAIVILCLILVACASAQVTAIVNVTTIDPGTSSVQPGMTVVIEGKQIRAVQPASATIPPQATRIDGTAKFLIPGLHDSHVHLTKSGAGSLPLFIANGVTSVRDMGSDLAEVVQWRQQINRGTIVGPQITTSGQILESASNVARMKKEATIEPVDRIRIGLANPDDARRAVQRLKAGGADHLKMRTTPDSATFQAVAAEGRRVGLRLTMHPVATLDEMIRAGVGSVEHFVAFPPLDNIPAEDRRALFTRMRDAGMFLSTTIINIDGSIRIPYSEGKRRLDDKTGAVDPLRKYVCGYLLEDWREQVEEREDGAYDEYLKMVQSIYRDIREVKEAGVRTIAGTDTGVAFMYPGFSMHDELAKLVEHTAYTPMEALRAATFNAAAFHGHEKIVGSIAAGQTADLILLNADPLKNVSSTRAIRGVMAQGRWFDRAALDVLLTRAAQACSK